MKVQCRVNAEEGGEQSDKHEVALSLKREGALTDGARKLAFYRPSAHQLSNSNFATRLSPTLCISETRTQMRQLEVIEDFKSVQKAGHAILLVWVNWSMHARKAEAALLTAIEQLESDDGHLKFETFRIDLSAQNDSPIYCDATDFLIELGVSHPHAILNAGAGSVIWINRGTAVFKIENGSSVSSEQLVNYTVRAFGRKDA